MFRLHDISDKTLRLKNKRIHFIGIGGISMSSIAIMSKREGAIVSGCDICENAGTRACSEAGIRVEIGHSVTHVEKSEIVVFSSAIPQNNLEMMAANRNGVKIVPRAVMLSRLLRDKESIGIAGSHGKTTSTYIVSQLFRDHGFDPAVMLGGRVNEWNSNFHLGKGKHFISEVDESDGSLLFLNLEHSLITNVDLDHVDFYRDIGHLKEVFRKYAVECNSGKIVACGDNSNLRDSLEGIDKEVSWYGLAEGNDFRAVNVQPVGLGRKFDLEHSGEHIGEFVCPMLGTYNLLNCIGSISLGYLLGLDPKKMARTTANLHGVVRRQDLLGEKNGVKVLDDYAHHPTEITATIRALKELMPNRLVVVFQPHRYSRTAALYKDLAKSLSEADYVVISEIYPANEEAISGVSSSLIARELNRLKFFSYQYIQRDSLIIRHLETMCRPGDLVVTMGAGDVRKLGEQFVK